MRKWLKWLIVLFVILLFMGIGYIVANFLFLDFFIDSWWFASLGYQGYFYEKLTYRFGVFMAVFAVFFAIFFVNFLAASRLIDRQTTPKPSRGKKSYVKFLAQVRSVSMKIYTPISALLAFCIAIPFYQNWEKALLYFFGPRSGMADPLYNNDISYYLFSYPIYKEIELFLLVTFLILFSCLFLLYLIERWLLSKDDLKLPFGAKLHLTALVVFTMCIQLWGFMLQRHALLYTTEHAPKFFGPGYTQIHYTLPLIWINAVLFCITCLAVIVFVLKRKGLKILVTSSILLLFAIGLRNWPGGEKFFFKFIVESNEILYQKPYVDNCIKSTLAAYNLDKIETREYKIKTNNDLTSSKQLQKSIRNIPVWDRNLLGSVFRQKEALRKYYTFPTVDVDRYEVQGTYQQVYLAAREMRPTGDKWETRHMAFTHGSGIVMTPAAQGGDEEMIWFLRDNPPKSDFGLKLKNYRIYYGFEDYDYVIVPNKKGEFEYSEDKEVTVNYEGSGGIELSFFKKMLFWFYFDEFKIFWTDFTQKGSRILFRRNVNEIIKTITPDLQLDEDPYLISTREGLFWIQDAYTSSAFYPNAQPFSDTGVNYIRNSIKIVVNAYSGAIDYYVADAKDPIAKAYKRIYSSLFKDVDEMPHELRVHLRYPKSLFNIQMHIYQKYHQGAESLWDGQDDWVMSRMVQQGRYVSISPYYMTLNLFDQDKQDFMLLQPISPKGRENLRALAIVGCDRKNYGKMVIYSFTKSIDGPAQVSTLIDQDTEISQQLTLWDQAGSEVIRGRMITMPVDDIILYIQPVYLSSATRTKIPELKRLIVSQGTTVAMAPSIEEALEKLETKIKERLERQQKRFAPTPDNEVESEKPEPEKPDTAKPEPEKPQPDVQGEPKKHQEPNKNVT